MDRERGIHGCRGASVETAAIPPTLESEMKFRAFPRPQLILPAALSLALMAPLSAAASAVNEYQTWSRVAKALSDAGYTAVEEIDSKLFGRFEVEAIHGDGQEYQLTISSDARITGKQARGPAHASRDLLAVQAVPRVLSWLEERRYSDLDQIGGDDGLVEIEARSADGKRQEIQLSPETLQIVTTERD